MPDDLDRAVDARIDAFRPDQTPPFSALEDRHRSRTRRHKVVAVSAVLVAALLAAPVAWSAVAGGGDGLLQQADSAPPTVEPEATFGLHAVLEVSRRSAAPGDPQPAPTAGLPAWLSDPACRAGREGGTTSGLEEAGTTACGLHSPEVYRLGPAALSAGTDIYKAVASRDAATGDWSVQLELTPEGAAAFAEVTGEAACAPMGSDQRRIAYVLDGVVISGDVTIAPDVSCGVGITSRTSVLPVPGLDEAKAAELLDRIHAAVRAALAPPAAQSPENVLDLTIVGPESSGALSQAGPSQGTASDEVVSLPGFLRNNGSKPVVVLGLHVLGTDLRAEMPPGLVLDEGARLPLAFTRVVDCSLVGALPDQFRLGVSVLAGGEVTSVVLPIPAQVATLDRAEHACTEARRAANTGAAEPGTRDGQPPATGEQTAPVN